MRRTNQGQYRPTALAAAVLTGILALTTACGSDSSSEADAAPETSLDTVLDMPDLAGQTIVINTYGGSFAEAFTEAVVDPFQKATGATVKLVTTCCDNFETSVEQGQFAGDIVLGNDYGPMQGWADAGLLESDERLSEIAEARDIEDGYFQDDLIAVDFYAYVLAWNTDKVDEAPTSWADLYDVDAFPGKRGLIVYPSASLETALLADGATADDLYPLDTDKAMAKLEELRDTGDLAFWSDGADLTNKLATGEFDYAMAFSNRIFQAKAQGLPVDATFEQGIRVASGAAIPKGAKNVDGAVAFLDYYMQPSVQATFAEPSALAPAFSSANEELDPEIAATMVTDAGNIDKTVKFDDAYWAENFADLYKTYSSFMAGN